MKTSLQKATFEILSDSVPFAFETVFTKRLAFLDIGIEHVQHFKAPRLFIFRLRLMMSTKVFLHVPTLSCLCSELGPVAGSQPTEHILKTMGAHVSLLFLVVRISPTH